MAEENVDQLPYWACTDLFPKKDVRNVGDVSTLVCNGSDPVAPGGRYDFKLNEKNEYSFKILKVTEDTELKKTFEIVPYVVGKGDLKLVFQKEGVGVFEAVYKNFAVTSVLTGKDEQPTSPKGPGYMLPSYAIMGALAVTVVVAIGFAIYKSIAGLKKQAEFRAIVSKSRYADPFMDFNIELRELEKEKKFSVIFLKRLEETFKKCFFRVFETNVFFDNKDNFFRALKGLGAEPHEIRSFYVLEEEYRKFTALYKETRGEVLDQKKDFLSLAMRTVSKLKKYKGEVE
jgi:hypothetical protein